MLKKEASLCHAGRGTDFVILPKEASERLAPDRSPSCIGIHKPDVVIQEDVLVMWKKEIASFAGALE